MNQRIKMHSYPSMVAVIGTKTEDGSNFMAAGWHSYLSIDPPLYGVAIGRERYTYKWLKEKKSFSINFMPADEAEFIQLAGTKSGKNENKVEIAQQPITWGKEVNVPLLERAYLKYECKVEQMVPTGDHDWVVGAIKACHFNESHFDSQGLPDFEQLQIPLYLGRSKYVILDKNSEEKEYMTPYNE